MLRQFVVRHCINPPRFGVQLHAWRGERAPRPFDARPLHRPPARWPETALDVFEGSSEAGAVEEGVPVNTQPRAPEGEPPAGLGGRSLHAGRRQFAAEDRETDVIVFAVHACREAAVRVMLADKEVRDEARGVSTFHTSEVESLGGGFREEGAVTGSLILERLHNRLVIALDVDLAIGDAAPDGPKRRDPV